MHEHEYAISLVNTNAVSRAVDVPEGAWKLAINVHPDTADGGWGTAVVSLQWSLDTEKWVTATPITFDTTTPGRTGISVTGMVQVRLACTTQDVTADVTAQFDWIFR